MKPERLPGDLLSCSRRSANLVGWVAADARRPSSTRHAPRRDRLGHPVLPPAPGRGRGRRPRRLAALLLPPGRAGPGRAPELRTIAVRRLVQHTNREIAATLGCTERKVERKLALIRLEWEADWPG